MFGPSTRLLSRLDPPFEDRTKRNERVFDPHRPIRRYAVSHLRSIARWSVEFRDGNSDEFLTVQRPAVGENEEAEYRWHARGQRSRFCILAGMPTCSCIRSESGATADHPPRCTVHGSRHFFPVLLFRPFHPPSSHFFSPHARFLHYNRKSNFYTLTFLSLALRTRSTPRLAPRDFIFRS